VRSTENQATRFSTSDAAYAVAPSGAAARCLEAIQAWPRSVDELMVDLNMSHSTCSASVNKLMRSGWIYDCGVRTTTRSKRKAIVWMARQDPKPIADIAPTRRELAIRVAELERENAMLRERIAQCQTSC